MVENNPVNIPLPRDRDGGDLMKVDSTSLANKLIGLAKWVLIKKKLIKIYSFSVDKLNEGNTRYWFYIIKQQLRT